MCATGTGTSVPSTVDHVGQHPAAERALVDEAQRGAVVEQRRRCASGSRSATSPSSIWPLIPRCTTSADPVTERQPQVLAAPAGSGDAIVEQSPGEVGGACLVAAHRPRVMHAHGGDGLARDVGIQPPPNDLDLGKFRHRHQGRQARSMPRRRP